MPKQLLQRIEDFYLKRGNRGERLLKNMTTKAIFLLLIVFLAVVPLESQALLDSRCNRIDFLKQNSEIILTGEITNTETADEAGTTYTYTKVKVNKYLKGSGAETIIIKQIGGCINDICLWAEDTPTFKVGQNGRLYLIKNGGHYVTVCGEGVIDALKLEYKFISDYRNTIVLIAIILLGIAAILLLKHNKRKRSDNSPQN